jgi:hypothetical protein
MQAIKALYAGQLHSHLVRECPKTLEELYDNFQKFSRSEVLYFHKLDQQRKVPKESESSRPTKYSKSRENVMNFDTSHKQVHSINSDGCGPPESWEKKFGPPQSKNRSRTFDSRREYHNPRGNYTNRGRGRGRFQDRPMYCMFHERDTDHKTRDCPIFLESKRKMTQKQSQMQSQPSVKEVNHTYHWRQASQ